MRKGRPRHLVKLCLESLEERRCLAASVGWDGPGQGSASLTYHIGAIPSSLGLSRSQVESAIATAFEAWSEVADIRFTQVSRPGLTRSIDITFGAIDGAGGTLAQAYLPADVNRAVVAGDIRFDTADAWEIGNSRGNAAVDLVLVAVHEIGHALGLDHAHDDVDSVMADSVSPRQSFTGLAADDREAILRLYAAAPATSSSPTNSLANGVGGSTSGSTTTTVTPTSSTPSTTTPNTTPNTAIPPTSTSSSSPDADSSSSNGGGDSQSPRRGLSPRFQYWVNSWLSWWTNFRRFAVRSGPSAASLDSSSLSDNSSVTSVSVRRSFTAVWAQALNDSSHGAR